MAEQLPLGLAWRNSTEAGDFVVGDANAEAVAWIDRWPAWPAPALLLCGPEATGKTHLARVWQQRAKADYIDAVDSDLTAISHHTVIERTEQLLQAQPTELFHLLNRAKEHGFTLLLCARTVPATWSIELPDLRSRLLALPVALLAQPDDTLLLALLTRALATRGVTTKPEVLDYLLPRLPRSAALIGPFAAALDTFALEQGRGLTLSIARAFVAQTDYAQ